MQIFTLFLFLTIAMSVANEGNCAVNMPLVRKVLKTVGANDDGDLKAIVDYTQKAWARPKGVERWQMTERFSEKRDELMGLFRELGMINAVYAKKRSYTYAAIHGATLQRVESRINWLVQEWNKGVRFEKVVILSGVRALDEKLELSIIRDHWRCCEVLPSDEMHMIKWLWARIKLPEEMRNLPVIWVDAPKSDWRAHTVDSVSRWLADKPAVGSVLAVSNQPFISYQDMSMRNRVPPQFVIETIGEAAPGDVMNVVYLDNLSRLLFEELKWEQKGKQGL